jgi:predicted lipid-binding transport protein (Tim44 family)
MTINSVTRGAPTVVRSVEAETVRPAQTQAAATSAPAGFSNASSFQTASSTRSASTAEAPQVFGGADDTKKAIDILGKTEGGEELKKLLSSPYISREEAEDAQKAFDKVVQKLSPEDAETVNKAVSFEIALGGSISLGKMIMDKILESLKNTKIIPQY